MRNLMSAIICILWCCLTTVANATDLDLAVLRGSYGYTAVQQLSNSMEYYRPYQGWQSTSIVLDDFDVFDNRLCRITSDEVACIRSDRRRWDAQAIVGMEQIAVGENFISTLDFVGNMWIEFGGSWNMVSASNYNFIDAGRNHVCASVYDGVESNIHCEFDIHYGIRDMAVMGEVLGLGVNNAGFYWISDDGTVDGHSHFPAPGAQGQFNDLLGNAVEIAAAGSSVCVLNTDRAVDCAGPLSGYFPGPFDRFAMNSYGATDVLLLENVGGGLRIVQVTTL